MGKKSEKKVRSDKVNALRKQYDLFLEEDKKRKERNDYILQRLDKMRYATSAVLQMRPKTVFGEYPSPPIYNQFRFRSENVRIQDDIITIPQNIVAHHANRSDMQVDIPRKFDDVSILREISKKYILIPKLRTLYPDDYEEPRLEPQCQENKPDNLQKTNVIDNNDWRSKYDILEQLKRNEKEEDINILNSSKVDVLSKTEPCNNYPEKPGDYETQNYKYDDIPAKYEEELPEKDLPSNQFSVENELSIINNLKIYQDTIQAKMQISNESNVASEINPTVKEPEIIEQHPTPVKELYAPQQEQNVYYKEPNVEEFVPIENVEEMSPIQNVVGPQQSEYGNNLEEYEQHAPAEHDLPQVQDNVYLEQNEYTPPQVINPTELVEQLQNEPHEIHDNDNTRVDTEFPNDVINLHEFTPEQGVALQDGVNINPEDYAIDQQTAQLQNSEEYNVAEHETLDQPGTITTAENYIDNSGIEEFDAEQKEMFYSEQQDPNYAYNQQADGDAYNQEYAHDPNYQQNAGYDYYAEADQLDAQPVVINEHEESTERYDQNYEQQYDNNYVQETYPQQYDQGQEQPQYEETGQFEQPQLYDEMQEGYEQYSYDQQNKETVEQIEQVLDKEDAYVSDQQPVVEKQSVEVEKTS